MKRGIILPLMLMFLSHGVQAAEVQTFVSPDSAFSAISGFISSSESSLIVASYTFGSPEIAEMLTGKKSEGVGIEVLVEKSPAGGMDEGEEEVLCYLAEKGVKVMVYDGPLRYMHAKYLIRDGASVLVTSENLGYSGFFPGGDYGNRGWGAIVHDAGIAGELGNIYEEDASESAPFVCSIENYSVSSWKPAGGYPGAFEMQTFGGQEAEIVASPDSLDALLGLIESANRTILVQQFYIYAHWGSPSADSIETSPNPLLEALIEKAREGVSVRILLDSTYYNMEEDQSVSNYNTISYVNAIAAEEGIPIEADAIDLDRHGLAKVHNKGMVVDGKAALVSSINWNQNSVMNNREVGLVVRGDAAGYYASVFEYDWGEVPGEEVRGFGFLPAMISLAALAAAIAYLALRERG